MKIGYHSDMLELRLFVFVGTHSPLALSFECFYFNVCTFCVLLWMTLFLSICILVWGGCGGGDGCDGGRGEVVMGWMWLWWRWW